LCSRSVIVCILLSHNILISKFSTPFHATRSLDYAILIAGEVELLLDDGSVTKLQTPGDVVVQRGTSHAWRIPEGKRARMLFIHTDAEKFNIGDTEVDGKKNILNNTF
jgi:hypothetical protein